MSETLTFPLFPRRLVAGPAFGAMRARTRGAGLDVVGSHPYRAGDDVRRIDWHASARLTSLRGSDEFVVREHLTEEATEVVVIADRSPSMNLCPSELPWLSKPQAVHEATSLIGDSALAAGCVVTDDHDGDGGSIESTLEAVLAQGRRIPAGSMLFLLSDFLAAPGQHFHAGLSRGWDLVPVVIQDPLWEQTFPEVAGALLPLADPETGRARATRLSAREVRERREANESRLAELLDGFHALGVDSVVLSSADPAHVFGAFLDWAHGRHRGARVAR